MPELETERRGHVLVVTLNRPEAMNSLTVALQEELTGVWLSLKDDRSVRAIVLTATGDRAFCTGIDVKELAARGGHRASPDNVHDFLRLTPLNCDVWVPTIVAINGVCAAAGFHFVADADVVIASDSASFVDTHVNVGQVCAIEPITLLPRIGLGNALKLAVLGRGGRLSAADALRISLVDEVVPPDRLLERALELAAAAAEGSPSAIEISKRAIRVALEMPMHDAMQEGWRLLKAHRDHPDNLEGPRAFVEKRAPQWG